MPVEFLTEDQQRRYGRYTEDPSPLQLARYFHFDDRDHRLIAQRQTEYTRLGFAVQLGTVRFLGTFLPNPTDVPAPVVAYVATQLGIRDTTCLAQYHSRDTHWDHAIQIRRVYGYHEFHEPREVFRLVRWLYTRALLSSERPSVLRSEQAVQVNIAIMRAFVRMREAMISHKEMARRIDDMERKYDTQFKAVFDALRRLMEPSASPKKRPIGYIIQENDDC